MALDPKPQLFLDAYQSGPDVMVILKGRLVLDNCDPARKRLHALLTGGVERLYLYLGRLDFVDSAGWGAMVGLKMAANRSRASLVFLSPTPRISDIFKISKLDTIFEILTGPEAELIRGTLLKRENLLWRDTPDESQNQFNTESPAGTPAAPAALGGPVLPRAGAPVSLAAPRPADPVKADIERWSKDAVEHLRQGDYAKAAASYRKVLELDPEDLSAMNNLGVVLEKRPDWKDEAVKIWRRVLEVSDKRNDAKHADRARKHLDMLGAKA